MLHSYSKLVNQAYDFLYQVANAMILKGANSHYLKVEPTQELNILNWKRLFLHQTLLVLEVFQPKY